MSVKMSCSSHTFSDFVHVLCLCEDRTLEVCGQECESLESLKKRTSASITAVGESRHNILAALGASVATDSM